MDSVHDTEVWASVSFLIQKSLDQRMFAPPQGLSQLTTSFIGSQCQGILLAPFVAWPFVYLSINISLFRFSICQRDFTAWWNYRFFLLSWKKVSKELSIFHPVTGLLYWSFFGSFFAKKEQEIRNFTSLKSHFAVLYSVFKVHRIRIHWVTHTGYPVVGWNGLEPSTSRLSAECSNQLSYQPKWWR